MSTLALINFGLYVAAGLDSITKAACFDLDWTLIRPVHGRFPKSADDWTFLPNRVSTLQAYQKAGYTIVIFSNQAYTGAKLTMAIQRANQVLVALHSNEIYPWVFVATLKNTYRKPSSDMWNLLMDTQKSIRREESFYVGDAAGRPQDFDSTDRDFATNCGLRFYTPEEFFPNTAVSIPNSPGLIIAVGMPGSGKSTFYDQHLKDRGWIHANSDELRTPARMKSTVKAALASGKPVYVDATNPSAVKRREYILFAAEYRVPTLIVYFVRNGYEWNQLRPHPVPDVAYNTYFKNLVEPSPEIDGVPVVQVF